MMLPSSIIGAVRTAIAKRITEIYSATPIPETSRERFRLRLDSISRDLPQQAAFSEIKSPLRQRDALERADDIVGAFGGEETFVVARAEVPMRAFVIFVPKKSPDTADHDDAAHPIVPIIADVMKTQVRPRVSAFETGVIVKDEFGKPDNFLARLD